MKDTPTPPNPNTGTGLPLGVIRRSDTETARTATTFWRFGPSRDLRRLAIAAAGRSIRRATDALRLLLDALAVLVAAPAVVGLDDRDRRRDADRAPDPDVLVRSLSIAACAPPR